MTAVEVDVGSLERDWDAQIEAAAGDDVAAAIGILRCSQRSHQAWLDWIDKGGVDDEARQDGLMESEFHRRCIYQYEQIIWVIHRLSSDQRDLASALVKLDLWQRQDDDGSGEVECRTVGPVRLTRPEHHALWVARHPPVTDEGDG